MQLDELIDGLGLAPAKGDSTVVVPDLADDSRRVTPGALFIARAGVTGSGAAFVQDALERGAAAVILPHDAEAGVPDSVAVVRAEPGVAVDHALTSRLAERFFGEPSRKLKLLGITGTNGKTTVAFLARHLLNAAGVKTGLIGTIELDDGSLREEGRGPRPAELTTPGPIETSRLLAQMVENRCDAAAMEVSSHALHQGRVAGLTFYAGLFTNLTGDHLDYHGTMEEYAAAKAKLFEQLTGSGWAVINADDPYAVTMLGRGHARVLWTTLDPKLVQEAERYGEGEEQTPLSFTYGKVLTLRADGSRVVMTGSWGSFELDLPLIGTHNVANALQAAALAGCVTDVSRTLRVALETCPQVPGRLERVMADGIKPAPMSDPPATPTVLVDYAHTHDALENVLNALRPVTAGRLIALVGCGGDRDRTKRPKMAGVACNLADIVWITSDNPRTENPDTIIAEMLAGVSTQDRGRVTVDPDRAAAIARCIAEAGPDDTVLLAGKGHEDYQIIAAPDEPSGTKKIHFDDREHATKALRLRSATTP